jgi:diadenosine tetraphosphate (Ap4A) HIT family hydrolase
MAEDFTLDARLAADTAPIGDLPLSRVLLMDDSRFAWLILVPRRAELVEIADLPRADRAILLEEAVLAGEALRAIGTVDKLNIGALGNKVRQLHVHVVARRDSDAAWPGPVWGAGATVRYDAAERARLIEALRTRLGV